MNSTDRHSSYKKVAAYLLVPLLFAFLGGFVFFLCFSKQIEFVRSAIAMLSADRTPDFLEETTESIYQGGNVFAHGADEIGDGPGTEGAQGPETSGTVDAAIVVIPDYGTHYANFSIESVSIQADLYFGDSKQVLKKGVGQYIGSFLPGFGRPILISGHNHTFFHPLKDLCIGDIVTITTNYGIYEYEVTDMQVKRADDKTAYDLSQKVEQLIFYTCYPFDELGLTPYRYFVYADKQSGPIVQQREEKGGTPA